MMSTEQKTNHKANQSRWTSGAILTGLVLVFSALIHLAVPVIAWPWIQRPFLGVFLEHTLIVSGVETRTSQPPPPLQHPDRILTINGIPVHDRKELESALASHTAGESITLTVERGQGKTTLSPQPITIVLTTFSALDSVIYLIIPYLIALCYLSIGSWVFYHRHNQQQGQLFALLSAAASLLLVTSFDAYTTHFFSRVWISTFPLAGLSLAYLILSWLQKQKKKSWITTVRILLFILAAITLIWNQLSLYSPTAYAYLRPWLGNYVFLACCFLLSIAILLYMRFHPSYVQTRLQAQVILIGALVSFTPLLIWTCSAILSDILPSVGRFSQFQPLVHLIPTALFPFFVGYAIYRYQFMNIDLAITPLDDTRQHISAALQHFSRELTISLDLEFIIDKLLTYIDAIFAPHHILLFMLDQEDTYGVVAQRGQVSEMAARAVRFTRQDQTISQLQQGGKSLTLDKADNWALELEAQERARLNSLEVVLLLPLRAQDRLLGVLALGKRASQDLYTEQEIALLSTLVDQAAVAVENARLYRQQVEQGHYLVEQTRRLTDILALGNQLKSLDHDIVVQSTVQAVHKRLGFGLVTLSLVDEEDPTRVRVAAWAGVKSVAWERLASTTFPLIDFDLVAGVQKLGHCYFVHAEGSDPHISTPHQLTHWQDGDQLFVPLTSNEGLLGYLTVDQPEDGLRPTESKLEVLEIFANQAAIAIQNANLYASIDRALDERLAELSTLQEIDQQINAKLDFQHVMDTTLEWAMRVTSAIAGTLSLVSEDRQNLHVVAHHGYPPEMDRYWDTPWPITEGIVGHVVQTGEPALIEDTLENADYGDVTVSVRSHLSAPLQRQGQVIGIISLESAEPHGFSADDMAFLTRLADHATIAIENATLYDQTRLRVAELSALQEISLDLTSRLDLGAVLDSIAQNTQVLARADQVALYLYDEHKDTLSFGTGLSKKGKEKTPPIPIADNQVSRTVAQRGEAIVIKNAREHPLITVSDWQIGAIASIPLKADRVLGVFDVMFTQVHLFTTDELRMLNLLASQAAIAIKNAQLYAAVQQANKAKDEFVSIVSHELKVPMTSIRGYARLIALGSGGEVTPKQNEFINVILDNTDRMSNLVNDLLDSSRIESGRIQFSPRSVSLRKILDDTLNSVRNDIETRKHKLVIEVPADLPNVLVDPARMMQVFTNLLSNAAKYTLEGGQIKVWAQLREGNDLEEETQWVLCAVQDTGIGIAPQDQERLFQQFYRVRDPQTAQESGTGLGLSITRNIVELHGGRIWVESTYGEGSTFYLTLPAA